MAENVLVFSLIILISCISVKSQNYDYYWRDYFFEIPEDAVPSGIQDANGDDVYIGQIYVQDVGLCVGAIFPSRSEVDFYCWDNYNATVAIKILCSAHQEYLKWLPVNSLRYHIDMINKHAVIGGYDQKASIPHYYNIGRYNQVLGVVDAVAPETVYLYVMDEPEEGLQYTRIDDYEVLIYDDGVEKAPNGMLNVTSY